MKLIPDQGIPGNELVHKVFKNNFGRDNDYLCSCRMAQFIMSCETIHKIIQWVKTLYLSCFSCTKAEQKLSIPTGRLLKEIKNMDDKRAEEVRKLQEKLDKVRVDFVKFTLEEHIKP